MVIIEVHVGKNVVDDVLLNESLKVNTITDGLRQKLELPPPQPTPFNLRMTNFSYNKPLRILYINSLSPLCLSVTRHFVAEPTTSLQEPFPRSNCRRRCCL